MNSPIKLPPLPEPRIVSYQADSTLLYTELRTYDDADMRAYAEEAVRQALAAQVPVAWFIDWPDEPELGHYFAESPADCGRSRPLVFADASPQGSTTASEEPVYAYRRKGRDDFVTCDRERFDELSAKPRLFETRIFYSAPQASDQET